MAFEDLKDQLGDKWEELKAQLDDSQAYNSIKEKYEALSPSLQKGILAAGAFIVSVGLFSCPYSYWSESSDNMMVFEEKRNMIRDLLRASHLANQTGNLPAPIGIDNLRSQVRNLLNGAQLLPEQMAGIEVVPAEDFGGALAPPNILQEGLELRLAKLNLQQAVDIALRLQDINEAVKLAGFDMKASADDPHYFDVVFQLLKFSLPSEPDDSPQAPPKRGKDR